MSFLTISAALLVLTVAVFNSAEGACSGCFQEIKANDKELKKTLNMALNLVNAGNFQNIKIIKAERQVVAGFKYRVTFSAKVPGKGTKVCHLSYVQLIKKPLKIGGFSCK